jgi:hypothetical protein
VQNSNFAQGTSGKRHLVMVMVEAMGLPRDAALRRKLMERWRQPDIARLYEVSTGSTAYFGSTTHGEIRELCGRWGNYDELDAASAARCLPHRLAAKGYETSAMHTFDGQFLDRLDWYPKIGFKSLAFRDALLASGLAPCPGMFPGACDRDVPQLLGSKLKAAPAPQFVYWLTLNSHFPIPDDEALGTADCASFDAGLAARSPMVCRMFKLWAQTDERLAHLLLDPELPPTDILLVGDHMPPFNDRASRQQFDAERVPWVLLRRKR